VAALVVSSVAWMAPVLGEESCDKEPDKPEAAIVNDIRSTGEGLVRPTWWNYNIDELFEDHFNCGEVVYGYTDEDLYYDSDDDDSDDDDDDDFHDDDDHEHIANDRTHGFQKHKHEKKYDPESDPLSDFQMQKIRLQWAMIREKYVREINLVPVIYHEPDSPTINDEDSISSESQKVKRLGHGVSAMVVPSRVGDAGPGKGRGVYATEPISKGTLVVDLDNGSTGIFKVGHSWREFAVSLPKETACNFIEWSWVQTIPPENDDDDDIRNGLTIFIAFDESNLMNSADWDGVEANVRCGRPPEHDEAERGPCRFHYYAARDIAAGEELLINYGEFEDLDQQGWTDIGL